jgi:hypothetical protein
MTNDEGKWPAATWLIGHLAFGIRHSLVRVSYAITGEVERVNGSAPSLNQLRNFVPPAYFARA